jgi:hypothetical protein
MSRDMVSPEVRDRIRALHERQLSPEEFHTLADSPLSNDEREHTQALVRWFRRRYPTPSDRLAYVRRAHARWVRSLSTEGS